MSDPSIALLVSRHLLMTLPGWLLSLVVGGSLGYGCALVIRSITERAPKRRHLLVLFPWRSLLIIPAPLLMHTLFIIQHTTGLGLGWETGIVVIGLTMSLLVLAWTATIFIQHWNTLPAPHIRLMAMVRTVAIISISLGMIIQNSAGKSALSNWFLSLIMQWASLDEMLEPIGLVFGMSLVIDLLLGIPHMIDMRRFYAAADRTSA